MTNERPESPGSPAVTDNDRIKVTDGSIDRNGIDKKEHKQEATGRKSPSSDATAKEIDRSEEFRFDVTIGEIWARGIGSGMFKDIKRRAPHYFSDWTDFFYLKVLAAIFFMFFTSLAPAITFSVLLEEETQDDGESQIGTVEVLLSTTIAGGIFSILGGQPLCILGVTGPVSIFTIAVFNISKSLGIKFLPFYAWTQIWAAAMHFFLALFNMCELISWVTRYSCETFGVLIALIYLYTGIAGIADKFSGTFDAALFSLIISLGTGYLALSLSGARSWVVFNEPIRELIADYGATIAIVFFSAVPYMSSEARDTDIETLDVPDSFQTTSGRGWLVDLGDINPGAAIGAIIPGFILTVLFFFDHNVSSLLCQSSDLNLKKGSAYHWDFFVVGITILATGILGIPPTNGLIPQAPLHSKSLTTMVEYTDAQGNRKERPGHVYEQRVSNFMQALLIGIMLSAPFLVVLGLIPRAGLDGLFLYMGAASFPGNQFAERMFLIITQEKLRASDHPWLEEVQWPRLRNFTLFQALCCGIIFGITFTPAAMVFPLLIASLVLLRKMVFPKYLNPRELGALDSSLHKCAEDDEEDGEDEVSLNQQKPRQSQPSVIIEGKEGIELKKLKGKEKLCATKETKVLSKDGITRDDSLNPMPGNDSKKMTV
mmetsp:Transcript_22431/g.54788  ORF Transcript_22431/g.54788 Transcript_22431/m.54788 type:complete len:656 (-) Transcript_22431:132-2099(-)